MKRDVLCIAAWIMLIELFSDRFGNEPPEIYIFRGGSRAFLHPKREILPDSTIGTPPLTQTGVV